METDVTPESLTDKQQLFIAEYFLCGLNASKAARKAGYKQRQSGAENMSNPVIRAEIDRRLADQTMGKNEVLARLADHARGDMRDFISKSAKSLANHPNGNLIKKFKRTITTTVVADKPVTEEKLELELYDAQAALVHIGRYHKLFVERLIDIPEDRDIQISFIKVDGRKASTFKTDNADSLDE